MRTSMQKQLVALSHQVPIRALLTGAPGTGKGFTAKILAEEHECALYKLSCHDSLTPTDVIYDVIVGENNQVRYQESALVSAFRASSLGKVVLLIDEIDKTRPRVEDLLLHILEEFTIPLPGSEVVKGQAKNLIIVVTSNGRRQLREEMLRRLFPRITVGFPTVREQIEILKELGVSSESTLPLIKLVEVLRKVDANKAPAYTELAWIYHAIKSGAPRELVEGVLWKNGPIPTISWNWYKAIRG